FCPRHQSRDPALHRRGGKIAHGIALELQCRAFHQCGTACRAGRARDLVMPAFRWDQSGTGKNALGLCVADRGGAALGVRSEGNLEAVAPPLAPLTKGGNFRRGPWPRVPAYFAGESAGSVIRTRTSILFVRSGSGNFPSGSSIVTVAVPSTIP